ncbi:MAG: ATP-dependent DNA helicase RecG [Bacteroidetes Order II. Incertae sedis bacterium]|jgi:ATP-dependent DNA helicase RecG|nr:ATP-dependent DNA helicase RecG [Bacteroidetes Order II. bacterium]MBT6200553.1 ATP-dependent DNA helicase RecG [Bacteroidetes Order II. bacterium]MBT6425036.1 ATP-dependent DNA helicase RecG [Bacteroidetes Order II. bacterium]MBT7401010.1 ATP-dependent DNA helicase RecG [Bacteroidetes Order II. bacterium]
MSIPFLQESVQFLKGVGPRRSDVLKQAGVTSVNDLLSYYPRRYLDRTSVVRIAEMKSGSDPVTVVGTVVAAGVIPGRRQKRFEAIIEDEPGRRLKCVWFQGVSWVSRVIEKGHRLALHGKPAQYGGSMSFSHPDFDRLDEEGPSIDTGRIISLYAGSASFQQSGLTSRAFRKIIYQLIKERGTDLQETLPSRLVQNLGLLDGRVARRAVHFPKNNEELQAARYRLKFEELFFFQMLLAKTKLVREDVPGVVMPSGGALVSKFVSEVLPFTLTNAQKTALLEIGQDLSSGHQMNRLLQGDVGSGKTVVAVAAALTAIDSGYQVAFMAPTEILSEQHYRSLSALLKPLQIPVALLTGSTPAEQRRSVLAALENGTLPIVVGTHAIIQGKVHFKRLGFSVVDEQHRFGVMQRATLFEKGERPHMLLMTATPIPRSLALTLYGDLDVSVMRERPPGRQPIQTKMVREKERDAVYAQMDEAIASGRQCYVVYPLVEESEKLDLKDAVSGHEQVSSRFSDVSVELVHGRMKAAEKEEAMARFVSGEASILVSTTVIEVGVDVPNATFMLIEHAERFGLSQLHQLRGRIGRGEHASTCMLMAEYKQSEESRLRLRTMEKTNDGFQISEVDMEIRGAGDFFGTRQSGLPAFRIADLLNDQHILVKAREAAFGLLEQDPDLNDGDNRAMKDYFEHFVQKKGVRLSRIG